MAAAYLSLGCNLGSCRDSLKAAIGQLGVHEAIEVTAVSSVYITEPVGVSGPQPDFHNLALALETGLGPKELLSACRAVEESLGGRTGRIPLGPRTIDIDILLYGKERLADEELTVPHPRMLKRAFVLEPLAEIAPGLVLPDGRTAADAAASLDDPHRVVRAGRL